MNLAWLTGVPTSFMVLVATLAWTGSATAQQAGRRILAPGVLTVIPPVPAEKETMHSPVPLKEVLAELDGLDWTPNLYAKSETLLEKAKAVGLRREIWNIEFAFKPLRRIQVDIPQPTGKMQRKNIYYMVYRVRNPGNTIRPTEIKDDTFGHVTFGSERAAKQPLHFNAHFVLSGRVLVDGKYVTKEYLDRVIPAARRAIEDRETPGLTLLNTVDIVKQDLPVGDETSSKAVWGVVTWEDLDPRIDFFSIYVQGLTNAYLYQDPENGPQKGDVPGKGKRYATKTLQLNFHRSGDSLHEHEDEMKFGVRLDGDPGEQARILSLYGLKEPLDSLWLYR